MALEEPKAASRQSPSPTQKRILCAEDDPAIADLLARILQSAGYLVECVPDGIDAWIKISGDLGYFHAVITDHQMPGLDGAELVNVLREAKYPGRILVHSSSLSKVDELRYQSLRVDGVLEKPVEAKSLLAVLRKVLADSPDPSEH